MTRGATKDKVLRRDAFLVPNSLPTKTRCIEVQIPDGFEYEVLLYSALQLLCKWNSYQQDGAHRAADVAYLWRQALKLEKCDETQSFDGVFVEDCMSCGFRVNPDNNCQLQVWCNEKWELFWDINSCVAIGGAQPTGGGELGAGDCLEYDAHLDANGQWLLPVQVSAGDIVTITGATGGWSDGTILWYCPNGFTYALGACVSASAPVGTDPMPALSHMRLISNIGGSAYYDAFDQAIAVPTGVTNQNMVFQANDSALGDNAGSIGFHVKVCRQAVNLALTYLAGSGPSSAVPGQTVVMNSDAGSFLQCQNVYNLTFQISPCHEVIIHSLTGWSLFNCQPGDSVYGWFNCASALTQGTTPGTTSVPLPLDVTTIQLGILSATPFSAVVEIV